MKLKTPTFKNKTASILWIFTLAIALILVDYFLSPVVAINGWQYKPVEEQENKILLDSRCSEKIRIYNTASKRPEYMAQACLTTGALVIIKQARFKGEIYLDKVEAANRIALNLQSPELIFINKDDEIIVSELKTGRALKFWKNTDELISN